MRNSKTTDDDRGNMERLGEAAGAMAGRAADFGMEVTSSLFRAAGDMLGGWWSSDEPRQAANAWSDTAEKTCRSHYGSAAASSGSKSGGVGATQATKPAPKSTHAAMQADLGDGSVGVSGSAHFDSASDGFERAKPGYQLGYVARQNPAYRDRSFSEVEPELKRVWESRSRSEGGSASASSSWPEVRGFVDFAYQQSDDARR